MSPHDSDDRNVCVADESIDRVKGANMNNADVTKANFIGANCRDSTDTGATTTSVITTGSNACP